MRQIVIRLIVAVPFPLKMANKMNTENTVQSLFEAQAEKIPQQIAIIDGDHSITYRELNEKANQLAHYLRKKGVKPEIKVALCLERSIDLFIALLGILKAGGAYTPLDASHPKERLLFILKDNDNPILIVSSALQKKFSTYHDQCLVLDLERKNIATQPTTNLLPTALPQHLAYVIYTSGSTGKPKGVLIEHRSVVNYCHWFTEYSQWKLGQRIDFSANFIFDMAITTTITPLMHGLCIVIASNKIKKSADTYLKHLADHQVNLIKITPSYLKLLVHEVQNHRVLLPHLQTIILGGENLTKKECRDWLNLYPHHHLFNEYGPTEATVAASQYKIGKENIASLAMNVPIGKPGPNMACYILDQNHQLVPEGTVGELHISGVGLARGYLNQSALTQEKFIRVPFHNERLYKTGDLCKQNSDETLEYLGRIDSQVKIRGFRVETQEVEQWLRTYPAIEDALVLIESEGAEEARLVAYYILKDSSALLGSSEIRHYLSDHVPDYMVPSMFIKIAHFPLTANGKIDKKALPRAHHDSTHPYVAPASVLEKKLASIWSRALGGQSIGLLDNFFELGGHSLAAARIISDIHHVLGKELSLSEFYQASTFSDLIMRIQQAKKTAKKPLKTDEHLQKESKALPLIDFQFMLWMAQTFERKASKLNIVVRKRMHGQLRSELLVSAFATVFQKYEIFFYRAAKFLPKQIVQKNLAFGLKKDDLTAISEQECEPILETSYQELIHDKIWPASKPLLKARLFYLPNQQVELQLCMPHIIADDVSSEIIVSELSRHYGLLQKKKEQSVRPDTHFREYVLTEHHYAKTNLESHINFWDKYLEKTSLFFFPPASVIQDMQGQHVPYSTYLEMSPSQLNHLQYYCAHYHLSLEQGLCAALLLAVRNCCPGSHKNQTVVINLVKSTREHSRYDHSIGCFLRIAPLKANLTKKSTLLDLARQLQQSEIETSAYQRCSSLFKLACISTFRQQRKIMNYLTGWLIYIYTRLFMREKPNSRIRQLYQRIISFKRNNHFLINVNIQNNFIRKSPKDSEIFGLQQQDIQLSQYDLLNIDCLFDACFFSSNHKNYIVISANLHPEFRKQIGMEMMRLIQHETSQYESAACSIACE